MLIGLLSSAIFSFAHVDHKISVLLDDEPIVFDIEPYVANQRVMVPARKIFESLGAKVSWDAHTHTVSATDNRHDVSLKIGSEYALVDNRQAVLDSPPIIMANRTMVPLRFISQAFGATVMWHAKSRTVLLSRKNNKSHHNKNHKIMGRVEIVEENNGNDDNLSTIGQSLEQLLAAEGNPQRISASMYDFDWYSYHDNYENFKMYGIKDGQVVALYYKTDAPIDDIHICYGDSRQRVRAQYQTLTDHIKKGRITYRYDDEKIDLFKYRGQNIRVFYDSLNEYSVSAVLAIKSSIEKDMAGFYGEQDESLERAFEYQLFDIVNAERRLNGLAPFLLHAGLQDVARAHSQDMIDRNFFDHINPSGLSPCDRISAAHYEAKYCTENIACGSFNAIFAHEDFMNSKGHRKILLGKAHYLAPGIKFGGRFHRYYTETFFTPIE